MTIEENFSPSPVSVTMPTMMPADAQVVTQSVGDADGEAEAEQSLGQAKRVEVAIAAEEQARDCAPHQRGRGEREVGQVRQGEENSGEGDARGFAR